MEPIYDTSSLEALLEEDPFQHAMTLSEKLHSALGRAHHENQVIGGTDLLQLERMSNQLIEQLRRLKETPSFCDEEKKKNSAHAPYLKLIHRSRRVRTCKTGAAKGMRECHWCGAKSTPEWRNGPDRSTLCNACGLQYHNMKKQAKLEAQAKAVPEPPQPTISHRIKIESLLN